MAKILIVEDSPTQSAVLTKLLEKGGHQVAVAADGDQGVAMAIEQQPDLVLMDIIMPTLNGFQATRKLRIDPKTKHIPVIILTTKDMAADRAWGMRQGAKAYVTKPFDEDELIQTITYQLALAETAAGPATQAERARK